MQITGIWNLESVLEKGRFYTVPCTNQSMSLKDVIINQYHSEWGLIHSIKTLAIYKRHIFDDHPYQIFISEFKDIVKEVRTNLWEKGHFDEGSFNAMLSWAEKLLAEEGHEELDRWANRLFNMVESPYFTDFITYLVKFFQPSYDY